MQYPTGPAADLDPLITSYSAPILIALYVFLGLYFFVLPLEVLRRWYCKPREQAAPEERLTAEQHLRRQEFDPSSSLMRRSVSHSLRRQASKQSDQNDSQTEALMTGSTITMQGFKESAAETILRVANYTLWVIFLVTLVLLMYDAMNDCQLENLNNMCFYGNYPILGDGPTHRRVMIFYTGLMLCVCVCGYMLPASAVTWILEPASLEQANRVYVTKSDSTSEEDRTQSTGCCAALTALWERKQASRNNKLVPVHESTTGVKYVNFQLRRYIIEGNSFLLAGAKADESSCKQLLERVRARSHEEYIRWIEFLGANKIYRDSRTSLWEDSYTEFVLRQAPWNIYALYIFVWFFTDAWWAPSSVMVTAIVLMSISNIANKRMAQATADMILEKASTMLVLRDNRDTGDKTWSRLASVDIVPGDLVSIEPTPEQEELPFDAVLISGTVMVYEKCFGTPHRIEKVAMQPEGVIYSPMGRHAACTLFQGSCVLPSEQPAAALALVTKTGINSRLGTQVWHSLQRARLDHPVIEFYSAPLVLLFVYAGAVAVVSVILLSEFKSSGRLEWWSTFGYTVYTLSQTVSPLLNLCVSRVTYWGSANRLKKVGVHARDPGQIALGVCIDWVAVTQPLEVEPLRKELLGCISVNEFNSAAGTPAVSRDRLSDLEIRSLAVFTLEEEPPAEGTKGSTVLRSLLAKQCEGSMAGPVCRLYQEQIVLQQTKLIEHSTHQLAIACSHSREQEQRCELFCQGEVSTVSALCAPGSVPSVLKERALELELAGLLVMGMAHAEVPSRFEAFAWLEANSVAKSLGPNSRAGPKGMHAGGSPVDLRLDGFSVWCDPDDFNQDGSVAVQHSTADAVQVLTQGLLHPVLLSNASLGRACFTGWRSGLLPLAGDNIVLGQVVDGAVQWRQVQPPGAAHQPAVLLTPFDSDAMLTHLRQNSGSTSLCITAGVLEVLLGEAGDEQLLLHVLHRAKVFAEMKQSDKQQLIEKLQTSLEVHVALCGDFSETASMSLCVGHRGVASFATFITQDNPLQVMPRVLREGRACVASTLALFQFIVIYGLLFSVTKMTGFYFRVFMTHSAYLFVDLTMLALAVTITFSKPAQELVVERPPTTFRNWITALSVFGSMSINVFFWLIAIFLMQEEEAFLAWPLSPNSDYRSTGMSTIQDNALSEWWILGDNWEASIMFLMFGNQMLSCAFVFQFGHALRDSWYTNYSFTVLWAALTIFLYYLLLADPNDLTDLFLASGPFVMDESTVWTQYYNETGESPNEMPFDFRQQQALIMILNTGCLVGWDQLVYRWCLPCCRGGDMQDMMPELDE